MVSSIGELLRADNVKTAGARSCAITPRHLYAHHDHCDGLDDPTSGSGLAQSHLVSDP